MSTIGERLKEERLRLRMNQTEFGAQGGVKKFAQIHYEQGERRPDADYLAGIDSAGGDVLYIVTGKRSGLPPGAFDAKLLQQVVESVEEQLKAKRRLLPASKKGELIALLYEHFARGDQVEKGTVERYLRLVA